jgi:electron-transferring-flavoprotein dehydrogenase
MSDERETLELDVVFVGAGPASLAGACHLARLARQNGLELAIGVLEKGREITSHAISGAVVDPRALKELFPQDWESAPFEARIEGEKVLWMTGTKARSMPIPPPMNNHGNYVASLGKLLKWMAPKVEAEGVDIFFEFPAVQALVEDGRVVGVRTGDKGISRTGEKKANYEPGVDIFFEFPAAQALVEDGRVVGVRTGDKGISRDGKQKANYEPGVDIRAQVVVLGEGVRGTLTKQLAEPFGLWQGKNPQIYAIGLKEVWD